MKSIKIENDSVATYLQAVTNLPKTIDRPLWVSFGLGDYGSQKTPSCAVIEVQGSPPKGMALVMFGEFGPDPEACIVWVRIAGRRMKRLASLSPRFNEIIALVADAIKLSKP
jgi:hypothetical protein